MLIIISNFECQENNALIDIFHLFWFHLFLSIYPVFLLCPNYQDPTECKLKFSKVNFGGLLANRASDN